MSNESHISELLKRVKKIELKSKGISQNLFSGSYHSAFKGQGMLFDKVREYQVGDEIRFIDWNVSARFNHSFIKVFEEERELSVVFLIDISASNQFGSQVLNKREMATEICATLAFSAIQNNDNVGVIFFSNTIEKFIPPKKGKSHVLRIIRELLEIKATQKQTDLNLALKYLMNVIKKRSTVFLLSDFIQKESFEKNLNMAAKKHDLVAMQIIDPQEKKPSNLGLIPIFDPETEQTTWVNTSEKDFQKKWQSNFNKFQDDLQKKLQKAQVENIQLLTNEGYIQKLIQFFKTRHKK